MNLFAETTFYLAQPWALALLALLPILALLKSRSGNEGAVTFSSLHILRSLGPVTRGRSGGFRLAAVFVSLASLILALSRPQWINKSEEITESGVEIILAIDVSISMSVEDFFIDGHRTNRLQAAKKVTRDFIRKRDTDRIGIIAFAGRPYLASPLTLSKEWLEGDQGLGRVQIGLVEDGTAIGSAIAASARRLDKRESKSKLIVLLTDGENNAGKLSPTEAAQLAKTLGIRVYTIAVGTYGDHVIRVGSRWQKLRGGFDEKTLREIASIANGEYFLAQDTDTLETIFARIDEMEKTEINRITRVEAEELFPWLAAGGILFGLLTLIGDETFWRRYP
ncbi:MAG: VWA domain-containing protein [Verrucomicrobiota bacterium]